jgi:hypothetical protein
MFNFKRAERVRMIAGGLSLAVYAAFAWLNAQIFDLQFWKVFGGLVAIRAFFSLIEGVATFLNWRLAGRPAAVQGFLAVLPANDFPPRENAHDDFLGYLARLDSDYQPKPDYPRAAKELYTLLASTEAQGILVGMRMHAASDAALDIYSPKSK